MKQKILLLLATLLLGLNAWAQVPKADLLDVVFNSDGTATDVSAMASEILPIGNPYVEKSLKYGLTEACFRNNFWGDSPKAYYRVDYEENEAFREALKSSHSFEALIRPVSDLMGNDVEAKFFSNQQSGGGNLMVAKNNHNNVLCYSDYIGSSNQVLESGIKPESGVYYHIVGVYDKLASTMTVYIDGKECGNMETEGSYSEPKSGSMWFGIGSDPSTNDASTNAFTGDVAIARVYGKALTADEVAALYAEVQSKDTGAAEHTDVQEYAPYFSLALSGNGVEVEQTDEYSYKIVTTNSDPYLSMSSLERDLTEDETVITFEYKCAAGLPSAEFFFSPITGGREMYFDLGPAEDWADGYVDLTTCMKSFGWGKRGDNLRLDVGLNPDVTFEIRNIHFMSYKEYKEKFGAKFNLTPDADGWYTISTPEDLQAVSAAVNSGDYRDINVRLANDIDMAGVEDYAPIGYATSSQLNHTGQAMTNPGFAGIFDGQGYAIRNLTACDNSNYATSGVFGTITGTVKNLGVVGYSFEDHGYSGRFGALCGQLVEGHILNCYVTGCTVIKTGEIVSGIAAGNYGGVIENCFEAGNNIQPYPRAGTLVGDNRDDNSVRQGQVINCYAEGWVTGEGRSGGYAGGMQNCQGGVTLERFQSGEIAYKLNGGLSVNSAWRQNIGSDELPVLDKTHSLVMQTSEGYVSFASDNFDAFRDEVVAGELDWKETTVCNLELTDAYEAMANELGETAGFEAFFEVYTKLMEKKTELVASAAAYATYQAKVDEVSAYLEENQDFAGDDRDVLETYLNEKVEPGDAYPNGSYPYIIETRLLNDSTITAEAAYVQAMLDKAIETGYTAGAEITNLLTNVDFTNGKEGWDLEGGISFTTIANAPIVGETSSKINMSQTLTGLLPGIYELRVKAAYRANGDNLNLNQASFVYANNNKVYTSTLREGALPAEVESPYLEQYDPVEDDDAEVIGYMPINATGLAYAFSEGYYENIIVTEVGEDGKLTIGVNTPGCQKTNTTWIGGFRLFYQGEKGSDLAEEATARALECQGARLNSLANNYIFDEYEFAAAPNYSEALKSEVATAAESYASSTVEELGNLMQQVYDCKEAYAGMMAKAEIILDLYSNLSMSGLVDDAEGEIMENAYITLSDAYLDGTFTAEEATSQDPFSSLSFAPQIVDGVAQIGTGKELLLFSAMVNSGFYRNLDAVLKNNIDMTEMAYYTPIGYCSSSQLNHTGQELTNPGYAGTFDGQGYEIQNLTATNSSAFASSGVFGTITGTVKNLGIRGYYFNNESAYSGRFGALCGQLVEGHILNCYVTESTVINTNEIVSGIAAGNYGGVIENCYEYGNNIQPYSRAGTLVGDNADDNKVRQGQVINCYAEGWVTGEGRSAGYVGGQEGCESRVSAGRFKSGEIAYLLNGGAEENVTWYQTIFEDNSPVLDQSHLIVRMTESGNYSNFDDINSQLYTMVELSKSLASSTKVQSYEPLITDASQLSENCLWQPGYEIGNIVDGNYYTYFHSRTDQPLSEGTEYFQVNLNNAVQGFYMEYTGRGDGAGTGNAWHDTPDKIRIEATNTPDDEGSWVVVSTEEYSIPNDDSAYFKNEEPIKLGGAYSNIRFYILHATSGMNYWNIAEFQLYSMVGEAGSYDTDEAVKTVVDNILAMCENYYQKAKNGTGTAADLEALTNAYNELKTLLGVETPHTGTANDPYEIASAKDLMNLHDKMNTGTITYVVMTDDVDMSEVSNWKPLNDYSDIANDKQWSNWIDFNGRGHVIKNLSCKTDGFDYASVFGVLCGNVRNVGFEDIFVDCSSSGSGVLAGYLGHDNFTDENGNKMTSTLENVWVTGKLYVSSSYCGGLVGNIGGPSVIKNCYANLEIHGGAAMYVGGLVGRVRDALTMENVYAAGTMDTGEPIVGGGQKDATPAGTYKNIVVWNAQTSTIGATAAGDELSCLYFYDGENFGELQQTVVSWGAPWQCGMADGEYPTFDREILTGVQKISTKPALTGDMVHVYTLSGQKVFQGKASEMSLTPGLYVIQSQGRTYKRLVK